MSGFHIQYFHASTGKVWLFERVDHGVYKREDGKVIRTSELTREYEYVRHRRSYQKRERNINGFSVRARRTNDGDL